MEKKHRRPLPPPQPSRMRNAGDGERKGLMSGEFDARSEHHTSHSALAIRCKLSRTESQIADLLPAANLPFPSSLTSLLPTPTSLPSFPVRWTLAQAVLDGR